MKCRINDELKEGSFDFKAVIVFSGTNDLGSVYKPEQILGWILDIHKQILDKDILTIIVTLELTK